MTSSRTERRDEIAREAFAAMVAWERKAPWVDATSREAVSQSRREGVRAWAQVLAEWSYVFADALLDEQEQQHAAARPPLEAR